MPLDRFLRGRVDTAPHLHFRSAQRCSNRVAVHEIQAARDPAPGPEICQLRESVCPTRLRNDALADSVKDEFGNAAKIELLHNPGAMSLHCIYAEIQEIRD